MKKLLLSMLVIIGASGVAIVTLLLCKSVVLAHIDTMIIGIVLSLAVVAIVSIGIGTIAALIRINQKPKPTTP